MFNKQPILNQKGLTLVELLVVIVIIGILAAILFPNLGGFTNSSQVGVVESDLRLIKNNLQEHYVDNPEDKITSERIKEYLGYKATLTSPAGAEPSEFTLEKKDPWGTPYKVIVGNDTELFLLFQSFGPNAKDDLDENGIAGDIKDDIVILHLPEI